MLRILSLCVCISYFTSTYSNNIQWNDEMMLELTKNIFALSLIMSGEKRYYETVSFDSIGDLVLVSFVRLQN